MGSDTKFVKCKATGKKYQIIKKRKPKGGYRGDGIKMVHLQHSHEHGGKFISQSVRVDLLSEFFEVVE